MPITPSNQETKNHEVPEEFFDLTLHRGLVVDVSTGNTRIALEASMGSDIIDEVPMQDAAVSGFDPAKTAEFPVLPPIY